jgi:uncharacterized coiled-coil DUF342 family protein
MKFDTQEMRARFHELRAARDAVRAKSGPLRAKRDEIEAKARQQCETIDAEIREIEASLPDVKTEMAVIARALDGKTGTN